MRKKKTLDLNTNKGLREFYQVYNYMYFGSRLPENVIVYFGPTPRRDAAYVDIRGDGADRTVEIVLDERLRGMGAVSAWLILHEMAHLDLDKDDDQHCDGPRHNKRMLELAKAGALEGIW